MDRRTLAIFWDRIINLKKKKKTLKKVTIEYKSVYKCV
jgi:hypothetical protein